MWKGQGRSRIGEQDGDLTRSHSGEFGAQTAGPLDHSLALMSAWAVRPQKKGLTSLKTEHILKELIAGGCRPATLLTPQPFLVGDLGVSLCESDVPRQPPHTAPGQAAPWTIPTLRVAQPKPNQGPHS